MSTSRLPRLRRLLALGTVAAALVAGATSTAPAVADDPKAPVARAIFTKLEFGPTDLQAHERLVVDLKIALGDGTIPEPTGQVTLTDQDGAVIGVEQVAGRRATFRVPPTVTHVSASYPGDGRWSLGLAETDVRVAKAALTPLAGFSATRVGRNQPLQVGVTVHSSEPTYVWDAYYTLLARPVGTTGDRDFVLTQGRYPAPVPGTAQRSFDISRLTRDPGTYQVHFQAVETPYHQSFTGLVGTITVDPAPAPAPVASRVTGSVVRRGAAVTFRAVVSSSKPVAGRVQVLDGRRVVRTLILRASARGRVTTVVRGLRPGAHSLTVRYLGSSTVEASARTWRVTVPRGR